MRHFIAVAVVALPLGCGGSAPEAKAPLETPMAATPAEPPPKAASGGISCPADGSIHFEGGDGSSVAKALVIVGAKGEKDGVASEYHCLEAAFGAGGYTLKGQSLVHENGKPYDRLDIRLPDGTERSIYFDISAFFGKLD